MRSLTEAGLLLPGLVDLHVHGAFGWDFSFGQPERINRLLDGLASQGLVGVVPTIITCSEEQRLQALNDLCVVKESRRLPPFLLGIYLEGPFLSVERRGSHEERFLLAPDLAAVDRWNEAAGGALKIITIAPELPGAMSFIEGLVERGIVPAIGHTNADHRTIQEAIRRGACHVTHLYNAMRPFSHRDPTAVSAILGDPRATVELIGDGIHVVPEIVAMTFAILGADRVALISDGVCPMGLPDGVYQAYGTDLEMRSGRCSFVGGHLFGGGKLLSQQVIEVAAQGIAALPDLSRCVFDVPLQVLNTRIPGTEVYFSPTGEWLATRFFLPATGSLISSGNTLETGGESENGRVAIWLWREE
jgi:N-acetylglucosamine-6-phosphate deacetylase